MKKIVIIYDRMGMGHLRMAKIIENILKEDKNVEVILSAATDFIDTADAKFAVRFWNYGIKKNWITILDLLINFGLRKFLMPIMDVKYTKKVYAQLDAIEPDIIISTFNVINKALGTYAEEKGIPFYIFVLDIAIFLDLANPYAKHICYFNETAEAIRNYDFNSTYYTNKINEKLTPLEKIKYVIKYYKDYVLNSAKNPIYINPNRLLESRNQAQISTIGVLAEEKHFEKKLVNEIKQNYNIPLQGHCVLLASGSIGGKLLVEIVKTIIKECEIPLNLIVACGKDKRSLKEVRSLENNNTNIHLIPMGYTEKFEEILEISDCIIGRPSAGVFIESLIHEVPMVTFEKTPANDKGTLSIIRKYKLGKVCNSRTQVVQAVDSILKDKDYYRNNINLLLSKHGTSYQEKKKLLQKLILNA